MAISNLVNSDKNEAIYDSTSKNWFKRFKDSVLYIELLSVVEYCAFKNTA